MRCCIFNHFRTLLANHKPSPGGFGPLGEEPAPASFSPVTLTPGLLAVRRVLFGSSPDREFVNYRLRQFLAVVHASPWASYATAFDTRTTYLPLNGPVPDSLFVPSSLGGPGKLSFRGEPESSDAVGQMVFVYEVTVQSGGILRVKVVRPSLQNPVFESNVSEVSPLPGSGYSVVPSDYTESSAWEVTIFHRPTASLGDLVASLEEVGQPNLEDLFALGVNEPYKTFKNLFERATETPARLAGVLLALAYRTEEIRGG